MIKLTFVLKQDWLELCFALISLYSAYFTWRMQEPIGIGFSLLFGVGAAYFYQKKNQARWCVQCRQLMTYGTRPTSASDEYAVVYNCKGCGRISEAGILTNRPVR